MERDYFSSGVINIALIVSIILVWMAILLPSHAALAGVTHAVNSNDIVSIVIDGARKGDRLVSGALGDIVHDARFESKPVAKTGKKLPIGCELAFSKIISPDGIAARCVTAVETTVRLGSTTTDYRAV